METPTMTRNARTLSLLRLAIAGFSALLLLGWGTSEAARANMTHPFDSEFSAGAGCSATAVAVDESRGAIYVLCEDYPNFQVRRFHLDGTSFPFVDSAPYIADNALTGTPDPAVSMPKQNNYQFGCPCDISVDNSNGPNAGKLYVSNVQSLGSGGFHTAIDIFAPSGGWIGNIPSPNGIGSAENVEIGLDGTVYGVTGHSRAAAKWDPILYQLREEVNVSEGHIYESRDLAVDSTGAVYLSEPGQSSITKYEADQFSTNLHTNFEEKFEKDVRAEASPFAPTPLVRGGSYQSGGLEAAAWTTDPLTDELYVDFLGKGIEAFSPGNAQEPAHQVGLAFGEGATTPFENTEYGLVVTKAGFVYTTDPGGKVVVFGNGAPLPETHSSPASIADVGHDTATLRGHVDLAGGGPITECRLEWGLNADENNLPEYNKPSLPCAPDPSVTNFTGPTDVSATLPAELVVGKIYHYRFAAANADGLGFSADRVVKPVAVLDVETNAASAVTAGSATLNGSLDPDGMATTYHFEYGLSTSYLQRTADVSAGSGSGDTPVSAPVSGLQSGRTYHFRLVAENSLGVTAGPDLTFTTGARPKIGTLQATDLSSNGATLGARIDPAGYATQYHFEYGETINYGSSVPVPDGSLSAGSGFQKVAAPLAGLQPGLTYHYRVVASNQWGTSISDDTTFSFAPPVCPNEHVRQQTASNYLPDCRAYELVSPEDAGTIKIYPSDEMRDIGGTVLSTVHEALPLIEWPQNTGLAMGPSRFMFAGSLGVVKGIDGPNATLDQYLATRTDQGWVTTMPALTGSEVLSHGGTNCNPGLSMCLDHRGSDVPFGGQEEETAPYVFDAGGEKLGRLPTNLPLVPGGNRFQGDQQISGDFNTFVFSSKNVRFTDDGIVEEPGSAYLNDVKQRTVEKISTLEGGEDIPRGDGQLEEVITFPPGGVSVDGSHIVMSTVGHLNQENLYLHLNGVTRPLAGGHPAVFAGMTEDGSQIMFTSKSQVTPEDTDTSADLYVWRDATEEIELVSQGNGNGNSDACNADWTFRCGVQILETDHGVRRDAFTYPYWGVRNIDIPGIDSELARRSGDIYFYSPESLDPSSPGIPGERNLYAFHDGESELVATLDPGTTIKRIQISSDGLHAAFVTEARLTGYDNAGFREMYTYDAETRSIRCASCNPSGEEPVANAFGSQGGPFMSDDGRAFFSTREALVPQDTDGVMDVYEYVGGRPQLITTGTLTRDSAANPIFTLVFIPEDIGLEAVSADGRDVYFTTFDTLVAQDRNGAFIKVYDARTNGGFEPPPPLAPCVAADECHGVDSESSETPQIPSNATLGSGGNLAHEAKGKARRHRRHRHRGKRRTGHGSRRNHD
jgi:hypothetical protein